MKAIFDKITNYRNSFNISNQFIPEHIENKTLQLFAEYDDNKLLGNQSIVNKFLHSLYYISTETNVIRNFNELRQVKDYLRENPNYALSSKKYFEVVILYLRTHLDFYKDFANFNNSIDLANKLNALYQFHNIPFKIQFIPLKHNRQIITKKTAKRNDVYDYDIHIEPVFTEIEEENKSKFKEIVQDNNLVKVNEHLNQSYDAFVKNDYETSIKQSYLVLEKLLKELVDNHQLDVVKLFPEYQKKYLDSNSSIFGTSEIKGKLKTQINMIYAFRSKLEAHSDTETFDKNSNLYEVARFQLNEVINLSILLWELAK